MAYGIQQEPQRWIPTVEQFAKVWAAQPEALAIMPVHVYTQLQQMATSTGSGQATSTNSGQELKMKIIFEDTQHIVVKKP